MRLLERTLPENITVSLDYDQAEYLVEADPTRIQQALMNLAVNARDAMPQGGLLQFTISRVAVFPEDVPPLPDMSTGDWVHLAVNDTGSGISNERQQHIFEPFYTTKAPGKGSGLGLAQVYGIVKQHGGFIGVQSTLGKGTTFDIYLGLKSETEEADTRPSEPAALAAGGTERILIVEDNPAMQQSLADTLSSLGYDVLTASNGADALALLRDYRGEVDLVLSDMVMPEMGGLALYREMREAFPGIRMLLMTGHPLSQHEDDLSQDDQVGWIHKPFGITEITERIRLQLIEAE